MADIKTMGLAKYFGDTVGVRDIDLTISDGELFMIAGPTGSGKSTIIHLVAGLQEPTEGDIWIGGRPVSELSAKDRRVAAVFPNYALTAGDTVFENIAMPLRLQQISVEETCQRVQASAQMVGIESLLERDAGNLPTLDLYRTAVARAFASEPEVLLMDDPLTNLDPEDRPLVLEQLMQWQRQRGITVLYATEDQTEAVKIADRVAVLRAGHLQQVGTLSKLYEQPANRFVARFIGHPQMNMLEATVVKKADRVELDLGQVSVTMPADASRSLMALNGEPVVVGVRPDDIFDQRAAPPKPTISEVGLQVEVEEIDSLGDHSLLLLNTGHETLRAVFSPGSAPPIGARIVVVIDLAHIHLFDPETGKRVAVCESS